MLGLATCAKHSQKLSVILLFVFMLCNILVHFPIIWKFQAKETKTIKLANFYVKFTSKTALKAAGIMIKGKHTANFMLWSQFTVNFPKAYL